MLSFNFLSQTVLWFEKKFTNMFDQDELYTAFCSLIKKIVKSLKIWVRKQKIDTKMQLINENFSDKFYYLQSFKILRATYNDSLLGLFCILTESSEARNQNQINSLIWKKIYKQVWPGRTLYDLLFLCYRVYRNPGRQTHTDT